VTEQAADLVARLEVPLLAELHPHGGRRRSRAFRRCCGAARLPVLLLGLARVAPAGAAEVAEKQGAHGWRFFFKF